MLSVFMLSTIAMNVVQMIAVMISVVLQCFFLLSLSMCHFAKCRGPLESDFTVVNYGCKMFYEIGTSSPAWSEIPQLSIKILDNEMPWPNVINVFTVVIYECS
jgi:hypothetical protein